MTLYDTACGSSNLGDEIIMEAVTEQLNRIFPNYAKVRFPTHYPLSRVSKKKAWMNEYAFVGGTNLLRNNWRVRARKNQWSFSFLDAFKMTPVILMGVGWNRYHDTPEFLAKVFYRKALSRRWLHSVRDSYTVKKLHACGIKNVINTGCPTLWSLTPERLATAPRDVSRNVVFTLTDYSVDRERDQELLRVLARDYANLFFWPQGAKDLEYFSSLDMPRQASVVVLPANLAAFDDLLASLAVDYIGTRLHAGIRAIQRDRKAMVIAVDNRATELERDHKLPVIGREEISELSNLMQQKFNQDIRVPFDYIQTWKEQFESYPGLH